MARRSERRDTLALALVFCVLLLGGIWLGGHSGWMPSRLKSFFVSQSSSSQRVQNVLDTLNQKYYRKVDDKALTDAGLAALVASLNDPYSHYYTASQYQEFTDDTDAQETGIGIELYGGLIGGGVEVADVLAHSPAEKAGLKKGDIIVKVGGQAVQKLGEIKAENLIRGNPGTKVTLTIKRGSRTFELTLTRALVSYQVIASEILKYHGKKFGYIKFEQFTQNSGPQLRANVERMLKAGAQGLILDLRGNPGGLVEDAVSAASIFISKGAIVTLRGRSLQPYTYYAAGHAISTAIPLTVLVDRDSASAAEILTAALQDHHRATVIGTHTYGKGVFQQIFPLSSGGALDITVGEFYTPNGRNLGGSGVTAGTSVNRGAGVTPNIYVATNPSNPNPLVVTKAEQVLVAKLK